MLKCFTLFYFINLLFKILIYESSGDFSVWFQLKRKSCKILDMIVCTQSVFFKFRFLGFGGLQPGSSLLWVRNSSETLDLRRNFQNLNRRFSIIYEETFSTGPRLA